MIEVAPAPRLEQDCNSLDAQREACEAYIQSQRGQGWVIPRKRYDDAGISGGTMHRPALQDLLADIERGEVDLVVVYKVDRLTRSLTDFASGGGALRAAAFLGAAMGWLSTAEQNRSKGRRKTGPFSVMRYAVLRVVPLVHRRAPRCFA